MRGQESTRAFRVGIAGPVGSGKTALVDRLSRRLWPKYNLAVVTNDIYTKETRNFCCGRECCQRSESAVWRPEVVLMRRFARMPQ
jgi:Ni2+-binding GTPase involved in maturation of urease and hydrogenase